MFQDENPAEWKEKSSNKGNFKYSFQNVDRTKL